MSRSLNKFQSHNTGSSYPGLDSVGVGVLEVLMKIVTSTSIVIKMELLRVTESAVTMEEDMSAELVTEI